jgi:hypothetical protein
LCAGSNGWNTLGAILVARLEEAEAELALMREGFWHERLQFHGMLAE